MDIGKRMKYFRKSKGFTVGYMAELMGVSQPTITRWENGTIDIPSSVLIRYIESLGITPDEFFADQAPEVPPEVRQIIDKVQKLPPDKLRVLNAVLDTWVEKD